MEYKHSEIEKKWTDYWIEKDIYKVSNDSDKPKYYVLDMFPYPSGAGLHVGHPLGYVASDIYSRYKRMKGFNVLHPMGFDAFGLPAEEYAIQTGIHPARSTQDNMKMYRVQLKKLGFSFDWSRSFATCDPNYYKWTQWIFTLLFTHYYHKSEEKARPVTELLQIFETSGNGDINKKAFHSYEGIFSADEWKNFSRSKQSEILADYRIAYRKIGYVNWCEGLGTVLANDQIKDGVSERGGHPVERKAMTQWYLRITAYADRLLLGIRNIEWSDALKTMQANWIGRSEGALIRFPIEGYDERIEVFTTRPDTIFGATYMVLAPEHDLVEKLTTADRRPGVDEYLAYVSSRSEIERMADKSVTGEFIGAYALHPFTGDRVPIWIGEYVLKDYGTGAIMAVPSDDDRDLAFATKFNIPVIPVIDKSEYPGATLADKVGKVINSDFLNGLEVPEAISRACEEIEKRGLGEAKVNYKLRDANFSRQRYWGEPFPILFDKDGVPEALPLEQLPLELPKTKDFKPGVGGKSPLSRLESWVNAGDGYTRVTDVMPAVAGSSWYYLRYMDPHNDKAFASPEAISYWQNVDLYVGGSEHAVAHLLYARFWHKFLYDLGYVTTEEPFKKLINQGMIQGVIEYMILLKEKVDGHHKFLCSGLASDRGIEDYVRIPVHIDFVNDYGNSDSFMDLNSLRKFIKWRPEFKNAIFECTKGVFHKGMFSPKSTASDSHLLTLSEVGKMSKRYYNVVNPDDVVKDYGADTFRAYEMFLGPLEQSKPWDTQGIEGVSKFIRKFWGLFFTGENLEISDATPTTQEFKILHRTIQKVEKDIEAFSFNTAVSAFMICVNDLRKIDCHKRAILEPLVRLLSPFAPFICEELWQRLANESSVHLAQYPELDPSYLVEDSFDYPICINGKKRHVKAYNSGMGKEDIMADATQIPEIGKWLEGKNVVKVIVVPKRMVNIVVK